MRNKITGLDWLVSTLKTEEDINWRGVDIDVLYKHAQQIEEKRLELIANLQELIDLEKIKDTMTLKEFINYKVKSAAYNWQEIPTSVINELQVHSHVDEIMEAIDKTCKWITEDPLLQDNFICDLGAEGVCLGWFDGKSWFKLWTKEPIKVYGWINIPGHQI